MSKALVMMGLSLGGLISFNLGTRFLPNARAIPIVSEQAIRLAASRTEIPVIGPRWIPTRGVGGQVIPGMLTATVTASRHQYAINFWMVARSRPVSYATLLNVNQTTDPADTPVLTIKGRRYATRSAAERAVLKRTVNFLVPHTARRVQITPNVAGWIWRSSKNKGAFVNVEWRDRGWLIQTQPLGNPQTIVAAIKTARILSAKVAAPMPGQRGTIWEEIASDGEHTTVAWQHGRMVYSVGRYWGLSPALTAVGSLGPLPSNTKNP